MSFKILLNNSLAPILNSREHPSGDPRTAKLFSQGILAIVPDQSLPNPETYLKKAEKLQPKIGAVAREIEQIKSFLIDLKNPSIPDRVLLGFLKKNLPPELFYEVNRTLSLIPNGEVLCAKNPRFLLQMKNQQGNNILEQYLSHQIAKLEQLRKLSSLYTSMASGKQSSLEEETCLQNIGALQALKQRPFHFAPSHVLSDGIQSTDTVEISWNIFKLHQLQDIYMFLHSPHCSKEFINEKYQALEFEIKTALGEAVWAACYSPEEPFFTDNLIAANPHILLECKNSEGADVILQLMDHYKARVQLQRFKLELAEFGQQLPAAKDRDARIKLFQDLPLFAQNDLARLVWLEDGGKHNSYFSYWGYGEQQIKDEPLVMTRKNSARLNILDIYAKTLDEKIDLDIRTRAHRFTHEMRLPTEPLDCSAKKVRKDGIPEQMKLAMVTAEYAGVVSNGGLAPAVAGMARAYGPDARIIMPKYDVINPKLVLKEKEKYQVTVAGKTHKVFKAKVNGNSCYLIEDPLFHVGHDADGKPNDIYGGNDADVKRRWAHFASLSAELVYKLSKKEKNPVELVHVHDAQTALVPKILATWYPSEWKEGKTPATVFTFHNNNSPLVYDSSKALGALSEIGLPATPINAFIEGMESSEMNSTVSVSFSDEVQTDLHGKGMQRYTRIQAHKGKLAGIVNGNTDGWNPKTDAQLKNWVTEDGVPLDLTYGPDDKDLPEKKRLIRQQLAEYLHDHHLAEIDLMKPIFFYVGRYDAYQKGIDKLPIIMDEALENDAQFICIGTVVMDGLEPETKADGILKQMEEVARARGNKGVCVIRDYKRPDGRLYWQQGNTSLQDRSGVPGFGSLLRAAVDLGVFPSIFEPCGLVQGEMHRMGIRTIATEIGGFKDTIFTSGPNENGNLFTRYPDWESKEQDEAIRDVIREEALQQHGKLEALYNGSEEESAPFIDRSRKIMANAAKSTWTTTFDGSPSPIEQIKYAVYAKALENRKKRGTIYLDMHGLKIIPETSSSTQV